MAKKKENSVKWVLIHSLWYWLTILLITIPIMSWKIIFMGITAAILHMSIDLLKYWYMFNLKKKNEMTLTKDRNIFFIDQLFHLICLVSISYLVVMADESIYVYKFFTQLFDIVGISKVSFASWIVALLIIHKPANIAISKLLVIYKPASNEEEKKDNNAGRFIGTIERIIMLIFISIGQYSAIGLVLTAKSIARYDKISKEKDFAEYYLLGTLISTVVVLVFSFIV